MTQIKTIFVTLALLTTGIISGSCLRSGISPFDYLNLPSREQFEDGFHQLTSKALLRVDFVPASSMEIVRRALDEAARDEQLEPTHREICRQVLDLSLDEGNCSKPMLDIYQSVWAQMVANFGKGLGRFYTYLRVFGQQRFGSCAKQIVSELNANESSLPLANEAQLFDDFRKLYQETFGLKSGGEQDSSCLVQLQMVLSKFDFTKDDFDGARMLSAAMEIGGLELERQPLDLEGAFLFIEKFMLTRCKRLQDNQSLGIALAIVSWARCLDYELDYGQRLLVLEEYNRLCLAWTRTGARARTEENVKRHLRTL